MLGRLRRWREVIMREGGLLAVFLSMSKAELNQALEARRPLAVSWEESLNELRGVFT